MSEVRIFAEGSLYWVEASATGAAGWCTASAAVSSSGAMAYVQAGLKHSSGVDVTTIMDRGVPKHHKRTEYKPPEVTYTFLDAITANNPALNTAAADGASVPLLNFELKYTHPEDGTTAYQHFYQGTLIDDNFTEQKEGNQYDQTWRFLSMGALTGSGYLG